MFTVTKIVARKPDLDHSLVRSGSRHSHVADVSTELPKFIHRTCLFNQDENGPSSLCPPIVTSVVLYVISTLFENPKASQRRVKSEVTKQEESSKHS